MYERFTDRARKVMQLANQEAQRRNAEQIEPGDLLVGIVKEGSGVGCHVLKSLGVQEPISLLKPVRDQMSVFPDCVTMGRLPHTTGMKAVIDLSIALSKDLNHNYVGTEHLLLGLMHVSSPALYVLRDLGLTAAIVQEEIVSTLGKVEGKPIIMKPGTTFSPFFSRGRLDAIIKEVADGGCLIPTDSNYLIGLIEGMLAAGKTPVEKKWYSVPEQKEQIISHMTGTESRICPSTAHWEPEVCDNAVTPSEARALRGRKSYVQLEGVQKEGMTHPPEEMNRKELVQSVHDKIVDYCNTPVEMVCTCDPQLLFFGGKCTCGFVKERKDEQS